MLDRSATDPPPLPPPGPPSLWRDIADGTAGPIVRVAVSVALAGVMAAAALIGSFMLAGLVPVWSRNYGRGFYPDDDLVATMIALASVGYLGALAWIWTRRRKRRQEFLTAGLLTVAVVIAVIVLGVLIDNLQPFRGSFDVLMTAVVFLGIAAILLIWVQASRRFARGKPLRDPTDGALDVRCPTCGYRMVGLHESRCPECGTMYTLDELVARQEFVTRRERA